MESCVSTDAELRWSIVSSKGEPLSTTLPKVVTSFEQFLKVDIYTGDSDPVYWGLYRARSVWGDDWVTRFCVGMLTYYHMGTAVRAANLDGEEFWNFLFETFKHAPRASERRHFRGAAGLNALRSMEQFSPNPNMFFKRFGRTYAEVKATCENHLPQFGPYFQLKICDYMDRVLDMPITDYFGLGRNLPAAPRRAIKLMFPALQEYVAFEMLCESVEELGLKAPPTFDRPVGPAEVETSLCGWKTTKLNGNWFGADIQDKREALRGYGDKADALITMMPEVPPRDLFICRL